MWSWKSWNKKQRVQRIPTAFVLFSLIILSDAVMLLAQKTTLKTEAIKLPRFNSSLPTNRFTGIGIDRKTGHVSLAGEGVWCEIPYRSGQFDFQRAFIAPTRGFHLTAVSSSENDVFVYDTLSRTLISGNRKYKVPEEIKNIDGMAYHGYYLYVADRSARTIYEMELKGGHAAVIRRVRVGFSPSGLTSDDFNLYACGHRAIYQLDRDLKTIHVYPLEFSIDGLVATGYDEFMAVSKGKRSIFLIKK